MKCLIIGGGPSGLAAGIEVLKESQERGKFCECIIFEKDRTHQKPCGGLITPKTSKLLIYLGAPTEIFNICDEVEVKYKNLDFSYATSEDFYTCSRSNLLFYLIKKFINLGGKIIWGKVTNVDVEKKCVFTEKGVFQYDYVIFANGYMQQRYKKSVEDKKISIGVSSVIPASKIKINQNTNRVCIWFLKELEGYCWSFPLPNSTYNVGFAGKISVFPKNNYTIVKEKFNKILGTNSIKYRGCYLPIDDIMQSNDLVEIESGIYRIGESGGYFDRLTGEGVYFALLTGILAARHLCGNLVTNEYYKARKIIRRLCKGSCFTRKFLYRKWIVLDILLRIAPSTKKLDRHMTDNLILKYRYGYYSAYLSPIFCYSNFMLPFNIQRKLDLIIGNKEVRWNEEKNL